MQWSVHTLFWLAALVCFLVGAFTSSARVNLVSLGLFFASAAYLVGAR